MTLREWFWRSVAFRLAPYLRDYLPPPAPGPVELQTTEAPMILKATPPALAPDVASIELHATPQGGAEVVLSLVADPVTFEVASPGPLSYFAVAVGKNGQRSDPGPTATFDVADTAKPAPPGAVLIEQVS